MSTVVRRQRNPGRKPGRPKRDGSRTMPFTTYFSEREAEWLPKIAEALGISISELLHEGIMVLAKQNQEAIAAARKPESAS